jgi:hypothetical protein
MISQMNFQVYSRLADFNFNQNESYVYELYTIYLNSCIHSYYSVGLRELLKFFDRSQILVLQYEKCQQNPDEEIKKTYNFLNVDCDYLPADIVKPVNKTTYSLPSLTADPRERLTEFFREEMYTTAELFPEIDLSLWIS